MTAMPARRGRRTLIAAIGTLVMLFLAAGLTTVGARSVAESTAGKAIVPDTRPMSDLPSTDNAALAVVDGDGRLTAVVVVTLLPAGAGGSIITLPVAADVSNGFGDVREPLASALDPADPASFFQEIETMLTVSLQFGEIVNGERLEALLDPVQPFSVDLPFDVIDSSSSTSEPDTSEPDTSEPDTSEPDTSGRDASDVVVEAGVSSLSGLLAGRALEAVDVDGRRSEQHANDVAIWSGAAAATPAGVVDVPTDDFGRPLAATTIDEVFSRLWSGQVQVRDLALQMGTVVDGADSVVLDQADVVLVFAQISPGRVSTPNAGPVFRIEIPYTDQQLVDFGDVYPGRTAVGYELVQDLLSASVNVASVDVTPDPAGAARLTQIEVADERLLETMTGLGPFTYGDSEIVLADERVDGIDVTVRLGTAYLEFKNRDDTAAGVSAPATVGPDG